MKVKRIVSIALSVIIMMTLMCSSVFANEHVLPMPRASTDKFYTPEMTAGIEWSGYADDEVYDLSCSKDGLTGEDINIYFYYTGVGMPADYYEDTSRTGLITVREDDPGSNPNETLFTRTGFFAKENGIYYMSTYGSRSDVNTSEVEDNSTLELYILVYIQTKPRDYGYTYIPASLIAYRFVTTYTT